MTTDETNTTDNVETTAREGEPTERDTDASALSGLPQSVTAFIDALTECIAAYEQSPEEGKPRPVCGGIRAQHVLSLYQAYRAMSAELASHRPAEGLFCVVTREQLVGMAVEHRSEIALNAIRSLEPAPGYMVRLQDLLALHALMAEEGSRSGLASASSGDQPKSYSGSSGRGHLALPAEPPAAIELPQIPVAQSVAPGPPVPQTRVQVSPQPMPAVVAAAVPRAFVPAIQPPPRPIAAQPPAQGLVGSEGFVDVEASGLEGLSDDQVIAAVTAGGQVDPSVAAFNSLDPSLAGSSGNQPQAPGQMSVQHPLIQQVQDPRTGMPIGGPQVGPSPQELQRMRRRMEGGG